MLDFCCFRSRVVRLQAGELAKSAAGCWEMGEAAAGDLTPGFGTRDAWILMVRVDMESRTDGYEALSRRVHSGRGRVVPLEAGSDDQVGRH